ncbi:Hypothetical protein R9X50_00209300 [Acrodontium crateriforme]|uniref:Sodium bile acid symporter family protein n=1 Tax=Acrodontium crateriforme TaxID=150365 RepID=A0AAQ3R8A7_9PEZI|nr:Hypothetical protein R9X50_00209300 [Acrodontium crateriforme]
MPDDVDNGRRVESPPSSLDHQDADAIKEADHQHHQPVAEAPSKPDAEPSTAPPPRAPSAWSRLADLIADQWFLIGMGIVIAIASQLQVPDSHQRIKEKVVIYLCVSIIFFVTGCTLDPRLLLSTYMRWRVHLWVQLQCFVLDSAVMFGIVSATATNQHFMDPGILVGMIFVSCVATTMSSNVVMTGQAGGNRALTVVQTTLGNFVGVFISPALVVMYTSVPTWYNQTLPPNAGHFQEIYQRVLMRLGLSIYVPLAAGQAIRYFFPKTTAKVFVVWKLNKIGSCCMLVVIWQTYDQAFASGAFKSVPGTNLVFLVFISIAFWLLIFAITFSASLLWLPKKDVVAITYCVPAKGPAIGVPLSTAIFAGIDLQMESKIQIPIVIYQALQIAFGSILISVFRRWIEKDEQRNREREFVDDAHASSRVS